MRIAIVFLLFLAGCDRLDGQAMTTEQIKAAIDECDKAGLVPAWFLRFRFEGTDPINPIVGYQCQPARVDLTAGTPTSDGLGLVWTAGPEYLLRRR